MIMQIPSDQTEKQDAAKVHNICGVLISAQPKNCKNIRQQLVQIQGVDVHEILSDGRMIITVEDSDGLFAPDTIVEISRLEGVLNASLVYHHFEPLSSLEETSHEVQ